MVNIALSLLCVVRGFNFKLNRCEGPVSYSNFCSFVDAQVGCLSLYSDCPTYDAECSVVNLPDSKRFSRSGLGDIQQDVFRPDSWASGNSDGQVVHLIQPSDLDGAESYASWKELTQCFLSSSTGQRTLHYRSDVLETVVLVNPSEETVVSEVSQHILRCNTLLVAGTLKSHCCDIQSQATFSVF